MNELNVKKLHAGNITAAEVPAIMDSAAIPFVGISNVNWPESYPYKPCAEFRIAHTGTSILLHYRVEESSIRAVAEQDNGRVWEDSCAEFFFMPADDGLYYNVESNCAATILLGAGIDRHGREKAPATLLTQIDRWTSLGRQCFDTKEAPREWQMALVVPKESFFKHELKDLSGLEARANFYKCGDLLPTPHFLSWNKIASAAPDFHRPEFFGKLHFE